MDMELKKKGWILSESALKLNENNLTMKKLLDRDLRDVGAGVSDLAKGKFDTIDHEKVILQVLKIRNISAPKANELSKTAPRMLKIQLTDGVNTISAIEIEPTELSLDTKPGTKIAVKVKQLKMSNGQLLFTPKCIEILGGEVEALVSKWELSKSLAGIKGSRSTTAGGPPPFIPFGQKIEQNLPSDRGFKSLQQAKQKDSEVDDSEFKTQRQDAIAEAAKGTKKVFGGGSKQLVDGNVQKIIDKGYTEDEAVTALKYAHNNVDKALSNLKRRSEKRNNDYEPREKRGGKGSKQAEPVASKPSQNVSLFSFLEDKIPTSEVSTAKESHHHQHHHHNERFENNISSSFRKHDKENSNKSHQWSSSNNEHKSSHNKNSNYNSNNSSSHNNNSRDYRGGSAGGNNQKDSKYHPNYSSYQGVKAGSHNYQQQNQTNHYQKPSSAPNNSYNNNSSSSNSNHHANNNSNKKFEKYDKYEKYEKYDKYEKYEKYPKPDYNSNKQSSYQQQHQQISQSSQQQQQQQPSGNYNKSRNSNNSGKYYNEHPSNSNARNSNNIVESMEKMSLRGSQGNQAPTAMSNPPPNYQPTAPLNQDSVKQQQQNKQSFAGAKPGSYPIVGFQNKEANEHAKNALKTKTIPQGVVPPPIHQQKPPQQQHPNQKSNWQQPPKQPSMPPPPNAVPMQQMKGQPPAPFPNPTTVVQQSLPQPFVPPPGMIHHPMPAVFPTMNAYPAPIIMQSVQGIPAPQPVNPQQPHVVSLKAGDACMAKYWEDGQFYNAKITAVGESTYVVLFTDYGNAEEVRKTDCLPLIPACPTPPHSANFVPSQPAPAAYHISQPQQKMPQHHHNYQQQPTSYKNPNAGIHVKNHQRR